VWLEDGKKASSVAEAGGSLCASHCTLEQVLRPLADPQMLSGAEGWGGASKLSDWLHRTVSFTTLLIDLHQAIASSHRRSHWTMRPASHPWGLAQRRGCLFHLPDLPHDWWNVLRNGEEEAYLMPAESAIRLGILHSRASHSAKSKDWRIEGWSTTSMPGHLWLKGNINRPLPPADPIRRSIIKNHALSGLVHLEIWLEAAAHIPDTTEGYDSRYWSETVLPIWRSIVKTVFNWDTLTAHKIHLMRLSDHTHGAT